MSNPIKINERPLGKIQIFIKPKDKLKEDSLIRRLLPKQIYREIVKNARQDGLMMASVYQSHSGFALNDKIRVAHPEYDNADLALCVELMDEKHKLEAFCLKNVALLKGRMIIYKAVEFWEING
ncbi:DUF190 domain-containing protein (plasmid) [Adhaeribacter swui]|uniref:DUF190 domain-containing protein n=1 Tax=Adhaeribacter swui TaxID=2086471 RepID=A0A7G7G214_9BACT|nr:DUF190 domain-containing protein [Adhaeribacter swui]QNF31198.1 DUF190 domain-containing protein [Adhaeribacter swui]